MSKIDCSNIFNFKKEWERRNEDKDALYKDLTGNKNYNPFEETEECLQKIIDDLQEWSDAHERTTRRERFIKICEENGFKELVGEFKKIDCNGYPDGRGMPCVFDDCKECVAYWEAYVDD